VGAAVLASATLAAGPATKASAQHQTGAAPYDGLYHFVRISFDGPGGFRTRGDPPWRHDYPRAELNFLRIVEETTFVRGQLEDSNVLSLDDPELFRFPVAYIVEPGFWNPTEAEVRALGQYLDKGGFLIVDDFRGVYELRNLEVQLQRALPDRQMMLLEDSNDIFDSFFRIKPADVVPPYGGQVPLWYGIYEDDDPTKRLQVIINYNNDIAEYWEYSDYGWYPIDLANEAYKLGVNYVVYAFTH
jgi:hypothetical protein